MQEVVRGVAADGDIQSWLQFDRAEADTLAIAANRIRKQRLEGPIGDVIIDACCTGIVREVPYKANNESVATLGCFALMLDMYAANPNGRIFRLFLGRLSERNAQRARSLANAIYKKAGTLMEYLPEATIADLQQRKSI
ncbi:MAG TPA: hypothetical protein VFI84_00260 [Candidatus Saccharimonadales bacterium]|nr:hypothetical protein [Candidatus Saccharimonadales bacterium]